MHICQQLSKSDLAFHNWTLNRKVFCSCSHSPLWSFCPGSCSSRGDWLVSVSAAVLSPWWCGTQVQTHSESYWSGGRSPLLSRTVGGPGTAGMSETCTSNRGTFTLNNFQTISSTPLWFSSERQQKTMLFLEYLTSEQLKTKSNPHFCKPDPNHIRRWFGNRFFDIFLSLNCQISSILFHSHKLDLDLC